MIRVVHCKRETSEYIGRPSVLGNPFVMKNESDREDVVKKYEVWIKDKIRNKDSFVIRELRRLRTIAESGELKLGCYCAPKACHGDIIKQILENNIEKRRVRLK